MKIAFILSFLFLSPLIFAKDEKAVTLPIEASKEIGVLTQNLIAALQKHKIVNYEYTSHKIDLEQFEGAGAGFNLILTIRDPKNNKKIFRKISCNTFYKTDNGKMVPDLDKLECE